MCDIFSNHWHALILKQGKFIKCMYLAKSTEHRICKVMYLTWYRKTTFVWPFKCIFRTDKLSYPPSQLRHLQYIIYFGICLVYVCKSVSQRLFHFLEESPLHNYNTVYYVCGISEVRAVTSTGGRIREPTDHKGVPVTEFEEFEASRKTAQERRLNVR